MTRVRPRRPAQKPSKAIMLTVTIASALMLMDRPLDEVFASDDGYVRTCTSYGTNFAMRCSRRHLASHERCNKMT